MIKHNYCHSSVTFCYGFVLCCRLPVLLFFSVFFISFHLFLFSFITFPMFLSPVFCLFLCLVLYFGLVLVYAPELPQYTSVDLLKKLYCFAVRFIPTCAKYVCFLLELLLELLKQWKTRFLIHFFNYVCLEEVLLMTSQMFRPLNKFGLFWGDGPSKGHQHRVLIVFQSCAAVWMNSCVL